MPENLSSSNVSLPQWIGRRASAHGDRQAVAFVDDGGGQHGWTYAELWNQACMVADQLPEVDQDHPRALLLYPPGIEFLATFLGCQIAGWIPVPTCYPRPGREIPRLDSAAQDCGPSAILGDASSIDGLDPGKLSPATGAIERIAIDHHRSVDPDRIVDPASLGIDGDDLALLQYTSGSTSAPKGVMVRHRNLMANLEAIRRGFHIDMQADDAEQVDCGVFWLPFFHDMGLIGGILAPLYVGGRTILMSPRSFLQRPLRWLQLISQSKAVISGAPNFAYQLCVDRIAPEQTDDLDLSRWRIAFSGAEPVLPRTLHDFANRFGSARFSEAAFYPCYGLAEATLLAAGGDGPAEPKVLVVDRESLGAGKAEVIQGTADNQSAQLVCCGTPAHQTEIAIVDPPTQQVVGERLVGEIWLRGDSITAGYWNRDEENEEMFNASLGGRGDGFCRTGDLGFIHDGQLYVTGRVKDVIILRGRNLFPQDIENTVRQSVGSEGGQCAAFAVSAARGEALAIIAEVPRRADDSTFPELVRSIRRAIIDVHEVDPRHVLLVRQTTVPLTSSGKIQRSRCREMFDQDELNCKFRYDRSSAAAQAPLQIPVLDRTHADADRGRLQLETENWMTQWLVARAGVDPADVDLEKPFAEYGLDSMTAVEMSGEIEDWSGVRTTPIVAWNYPTVAKLSEYIVGELFGDQVQASQRPAGEVSHPNDAPPPVSQDDLAELLGEIENLSEEEVNDALADERGR